ncbi:hypothetical protein D5R40_31970 [Okeania hirsuta]|uniref:Uncharacterized protein n=1 Tax=Okeania hirsuta TaxID=1458930 RepID=A0A3N6P9R7_9CYAN|nr:hypothetical protein D5R40_31970 [Okeania hirsuta]
MELKEYRQKAVQDSLIYVQQQAETEAAYQGKISPTKLSFLGRIRNSPDRRTCLFLPTATSCPREKSSSFKKRRNERLEQIDHLKDQFLANTSHGATYSTPGYYWPL